MLVPGALHARLVVLEALGRFFAQIAPDLRNIVAEIVSSDGFGRYVAQIWSDLREEATKGLKDDEARRGGEKSS